MSLLSPLLAIARARLCIFSSIHLVDALYPWQKTRQKSRNNNEPKIIENRNFHINGWTSNTSRERVRARFFFFFSFKKDEKLTQWELNMCHLLYTDHYLCVVLCCCCCIRVQYTVELLFIFFVFVFFLVRINTYVVCMCAHTRCDTIIKMEWIIIIVRIERTRDKKTTSFFPLHKTNTASSFDTVLLLLLSPLRATAIVYLPMNNWNARKDN